MKYFLSNLYEKLSKDVLFKLNKNKAEYKSKINFDLNKLNFSTEPCGVFDFECEICVENKIILGVCDEYVHESAIQPCKWTILLEQTDTKMRNIPGKISLSF